MKNEASTVVDVEGKGWCFDKTGVVSTDGFVTRGVEISTGSTKTPGGPQAIPCAW